MVKPKIACYITGGWTECGYMTQFLNKINENCDFRQRFPMKNIGKKGKSGAVFKKQGTTGGALISEVYADMKRHIPAFAQYSAVLIEDDLDDNYLGENGEGRDYAGIESRKERITHEIRNILGNQKMPVFFLYAMPEIEAWFIADWDDTFGKEYAGQLGNMNSYFSVTFRKYIAKSVLTDTYPVSEIENYGYFSGQYRKLSEELIYAFNGYSSLKDYGKNNADFNEKINRLIAGNKVYYSKAVQGINMLIRLNPQKVAEVCQHYFSRSYVELKIFAELLYI